MELHIFGIDYPYLSDMNLKVVLMFFLAICRRKKQAKLIIHLRMRDFNALISGDQFIPG